MPYAKDNPNKPLVNYSGYSFNDAVDDYEFCQEETSTSCQPELPARWNQLEENLQKLFIRKLVEMIGEEVQERLSGMMEDMKIFTSDNLVEIAIEETAREVALLNKKEK